MSDHPTPDDLANKAERDLAYAWECADRLAEAFSIMARTHQAWATDALAAYRKERGR